MAFPTYSKKTQKPTVKYTNFYSIRLTNEDGATLTWGLRDIYPRATVHTAKEVKNGDKLDYSKIIIAPLSIVEFMVLITRFKTFIKENKYELEKVDCFNALFENGKKTTDRRLQATIWFGKNEDGSYYFMVVEQEKKKCKFNLIPSDYIVFYDNGERMSKEKSYKTYAENYLDLLLKLTLKSSIALQMKETNKDGDFDFDVKEDHEV